MPSKTNSIDRPVLNIETTPTKEKQSMSLNNTKYNHSISSVNHFDNLGGPHFQQSRITNQYMLDEIMKKRVDEGKIYRRKGEAAFWKALDDSNDPENIKKVQNKVGDPQPLNFKLRETASEFEKDENGNIIGVHPK